MKRLNNHLLWTTLDIVYNTKLPEYQLLFRKDNILPKVINNIDNKN